MNSVQGDEAGDFSSPGETFLAGFEVFWRSLAIPQLWCSSSWCLLEGALEVVSMRVIVLGRRLAWAVTWCMDMARFHKSCGGRAFNMSSCGLLQETQWSKDVQQEKYQLHLRNCDIGVRIDF